LGACQAYQSSKVKPLEAQDGTRIPVAQGLLQPDLKIGNDMQYLGMVISCVFLLYFMLHDFRAPALLLAILVGVGAIASKNDPFWFQIMIGSMKLPKRLEVRGGAR
jgi:type IV secretory pathway VirB3-like protein